MFARAINALLGVYLFIFVFAVPMLMFDLVPVWGQWMGGFLLVLQGTLLTCWLAYVAGVRGALAGVLTGVISFMVEYVGVTTGLLFGSYTYTSTLGLHLGAVPFAIPFAWMMVVPGAMMTVAPLRRSAVVVPVAAVLALLFDMLLEPVVTLVLDYWRWLDGGAYYGVPVANFVAWGITALVLLVLVSMLAPEVLRAPPAPSLPSLVFILNMIQFTLVNLAYGFWWAVLIGVCSLLAVWLIRGRPRSVGAMWKNVWIST